MIPGQVEIPLLLFAKTPIAGRVKTRLQTHCSAEQAADIAKILLQASIDKATSHWDGPVLLSVWPDSNDVFIKALARRYPLTLVPQDSGDLGEKMFAAFECYGYPAAILGCDAPHVEPAVLRQAHRHLSAGRNVLAGSEDGGYYLIGLAESAATLFKEIEWGSEQVFSTTMRLARQQSIAFQQLARLNDVDCWKDVIDVARQLPELLRYLDENRLTDA